LPTRSNRYRWRCPNKRTTLFICRRNNPFLNLIQINNTPGLEIGFKMAAKQQAIFVIFSLIG
jgi:hypothetical protein